MLGLFVFKQNQMAFTQIQLDSLKEAIATGALEVWYGDKKITYRSMDDMLKAKKLIEAELGLNSSSKKIKVYFSKATDK